MSKQTEAMNLALEVLETVARQPVGKGTVDAITALQEALAEQPAPVQEPEWYHFVRRGEDFFVPYEGQAPANATRLYTTPQAQPAPVQGWKLVPAQPTDQMRDAGNVIIGDRGALFAAYHAMLAAAPQAQQGPVGYVLFEGDDVQWTDDPPESGTLLFTTPQAQPAPEIAIADAYRAGVDSGIAAEREACVKVVEDFARKWWKIHCDSNKHLETTLKAHQDFCALQAAIRARGNT